MSTESVSPYSHRRLSSASHTRSPKWAKKLPGSPSFILPSSPNSRIPFRYRLIVSSIFLFSIIGFLHMAGNRTKHVILPLLPPTTYHLTLQQSILRSFPFKLQRDLQEALLRNPHPPTETYHHMTPETLGHLIPNRLFQTDVKPPGEDETKSWTRHGFERVFMDDDQAAAWVEQHFGGSEVARIYNHLPLPILKADMLRYLYLLVEGGVYSDIDTRALAPIKEWAKGAIDWPTGKVPTQPVRMIVGIEGDLHIWRNWRSTLEGLGLAVTGRHRNFQIVQWTIAAQTSHPILVDCIRRILDTYVLAQGWNITHTQRIETFEAEGSWTHAQKLRMIRKPWEADVRGERMSVQEWTGPATFTDAVLSYLLAVGGMKEQDLYGLERPVQVGDVVVLPIEGYNPLSETLPNPRAKAIHLFRGSWKDNWDAAIALDVQ